MATHDSTAAGRQPDPTRITLIRHGESNVTVGRIIGGHRTCSGLSELGRRQSVRLAARLDETQEIDADVLLSSHFARAIETADIIRPALGAVEVDAPWPEFGEHDPGPDIDGTTFEAYVERFGTPDWNGDPTVEIFPGGETTADFHARVGRALDRVIETYTGRHVVVACHGGVVDAVFRSVVGVPSTGGFVLNTLNTSLTEFRAPGADGAWRVVRYNDAAHLAGLPEATERSAR
ncbi:histidine phosphatase family protein [Ilumatobacter nonamiensis]|uniref:histidine phosphatase family protein n=1 Tax=Ilumatobacter nonamiensis TaxID=467093 RepID=UPI000348C1AC|nr:histidine phosphatase family protein [Ilumatobacter nonamiensis]